MEAKLYYFTEADGQTTAVVTIDDGEKKVLRLTENIEESTLQTVDNFEDFGDADVWESDIFSRAENLVAVCTDTTEISLTFAHWFYDVTEKNVQTSYQ